MGVLYGRDESASALASASVGSHAAWRNLPVNGGRPSPADDPRVRSSRSPAARSSRSSRSSGRSRPPANQLARSCLLDVAHDCLGSASRARASGISDKISLTMTGFCTLPDAVIGSAGSNRSCSGSL
jgi:hypothetical protein